MKLSVPTKLGGYKTVELPDDDPFAFLEHENAKEAPMEIYFEKIVEALQILEERTRDDEDDA